METVKSSFWARGIWLTNRMNVDHNLFNSSKAYQSLEATDNSKNDVVNFNVESENDVNNRLLQSINFKARDCPSVFTTTKSKLKITHKTSCTKFHLNKVNFGYLQPFNPAIVSSKTSYCRKCNKHKF